MERRPITDLDRLELLVMEAVLEDPAAHLSIEEVVREVGLDPASFGQRDGVVDAISALVRSGLLHRQGSFVFVTRAVVRAQGLGL